MTWCAMARKMRGRGTGSQRGPVSRVTGRPFPHYIWGPMSAVPSRQLAALSLLLLAACPAPEAPVAALGLGPARDTLVAPFVGDVSAAAWLEGRRWVVLSPQDRAVRVVDFAKHTLAPFPTGAARELSQPFHLFRSGDTIYIADWQRRRLTGWTLAGVAAGVLPAVDRFRGALPRERDAAGQWYFELRPPPGLDGAGNRDSAVIARTNLTGPTDTVARLSPFDLVEVISEGRRRLERRLLSGQDRWGVLADGTVWVARVTENRVDWRGPTGPVVRGPQLPDRVLPVTDNDRNLFLNRFDPGLRPTVAQTPFTAIKPPFEDAIAAPDGALWLVKSRAIGDSLRFYQVVDRRGGLAAEVTHPGLGAIVALSPTHALVAEPFAQGVRLLSLPLPAGLPAPAAAP